MEIFFTPAGWRGCLVLARGEGRIGEFHPKAIIASASQDLPRRGWRGAGSACRGRIRSVGPCALPVGGLVAVVSGLKTPQRTWFVLHEHCGNRRNAVYGNPMTWIVETLNDVVDRELRALSSGLLARFAPICELIAAGGYSAWRRPNRWPPGWREVARALLPGPWRRWRGPPVPAYELSSIRRDATGRALGR